MIAMHAVDIVQPDICYIGGLTRALRVADYGGQVESAPACHTRPTCRMVTVFTLHMLGASRTPVHTSSSPSSRLIGPTDCSILR